MSRPCDCNTYVTCDCPLPDEKDARIAELEAERNGCCELNESLMGAVERRDRHIALLEAAAEAAVAAHEVDAHARKNQATHWRNYAMDWLADKLRAAGYLKEQENA